MAKEAQAADVDLVDGILSGYAQKGVLKGYARLTHTPAVARYRIRWFYHQAIDVTLDRKRRVISLIGFLPAVDVEPALTRNLRLFLKRFADMPEHRRVDETKAELTLRRKGNALTLSIRSLDGDLDYACRKLIHIANEVLLVFLGAPLSDNYKEEGLGVDPEALWG
jgi:hypothetical protein